MTRIAVSQLAQRASRNISSRFSINRTSAISSLLTNRVTSQNFRSSRCTINQFTRPVSTSRALQKGLSPETDNPQPKVAESNATASSTAPVELTEAKYHELSDAYLNTLVERLEELQESREDVDVEYSAGVLNLHFPPNGDYVLNKQPPNKQIWLSSPISGPKRFDFVMVSEGQDVKEGTGAGDWVYLRDGSALSDLLLKEVGVDMKESWVAGVERS